MKEHVDKLKATTSELRTLPLALPNSSYTKPDVGPHTTHSTEASFSSIPVPCTGRSVDAHKLLLSNQKPSNGGNVVDEVVNAPIFVEAVRTYAKAMAKPAETAPFSQYGLLGGDLRGVSLPNYAGWTPQSDPRIF